MSGPFSREAGRGKNNLIKLASPAITLMRTGVAYFNRPAIDEAVGYKTKNVLLYWNFEKRRIEFSFGANDPQAFCLEWLSGTCLFCMAMFCSVNHIDISKKRQYLMRKDKKILRWYIDGVATRFQHQQ